MVREYLMKKQVDLSLTDKILNTEYVVCRSCKELKRRIRAGHYPSGRNPRFVDENNYDWNGRQCRLCHNKEVAVKQKIRRVKVKSFKEKNNIKRRERYRLTGK